MAGLILLGIGIWMTKDFNYFINLLGLGLGYEELKGFNAKDVDTAVCGMARLIDRTELFDILITLGASIIILP